MNLGKIRGISFCMMCAMEDHANLVLNSDKSGYYFPRIIFYNLQSIFFILFNSIYFNFLYFSELGDFRLFEQEDAHDFAVKNK
jgi:hypothetical protein